MWTGVRTSRSCGTWSRGRHPYVAYFGPRGITDADIPGARPLVGVAPGPISGWVAASASDLTSADRVSLGLAARPTARWARLGGSILLYHFTVAPTAAPGPAAPAPLCPGSVSHRVAGRGPGRTPGDSWSQDSTLRRKLRSPSVKKMALKAKSAG